VFQGEDSSRGTNNISSIYQDFSVSARGDHDPISKCADMMHRMTHDLNVVCGRDHCLCKPNLGDGFNNAFK
jgi:hypothetical protein